MMRARNRIRDWKQSRMIFEKNPKFDISSSRRNDEEKAAYTNRAHTISYQSVRTHLNWNYIVIVYR